MTRPALPLQGACLYMPALHQSLPSVLAGASLPGLRVVVVCLEDALSGADVPAALRRVRQEVASVAEAGGPRVYVRPRNLDMLRELLGWEESAHWDGFVLPKLTASNADAWLRPFGGSPFRIMPILETTDIFDPFVFRDLCDAITDPTWRESIEAVRIGGSDLFSVLGTRRPRGRTIYDSILGPTVRNIASQLMARGLHVTAPVCESLGRDEAMCREVEMDVEAGFVGKTAVHPYQVRLILQAFSVPAEELHEAQRILMSTQAVFQSRGAMCEQAPHARWAERVLARASTFGVRLDEPQPGLEREPSPDFHGAP